MNRKTENKDSSSFRWLECKIKIFVSIFSAFFTPASTLEEAYFDRRPGISSFQKLLSLNSLSLSLLLLCVSQRTTAYTEDHLCSLSLFVPYRYRCAKLSRICTDLFLPSLNILLSGGSHWGTKKFSSLAQKSADFQARGEPYRFPGYRKWMVAVFNWGLILDNAGLAYQTFKRHIQCRIFS